MVSLAEKPLTGEPDAGNPPVRFGGRGGANHATPTPIRGQCPDAPNHYRQKACEEELPLYSGGKPHAVHTLARDLRAMQASTSTQVAKPLILGAPASCRRFIEYKFLCARRALREN